MSWKPPENEEAWQECLSAYLDGEMPDEERRNLEQYLRNDARRASQLSELQRLSGILSEWEIPAPEPSPVFENKIRTHVSKNTSRAKYSSLNIIIPWKLRWAVHAAIFLLGALVGGLVMSLALMNIMKQSAEFIPPEKRPAPQRIQAASPETSLATISPSQADALLREISAAQLKEKMVGQIKRQNWDQAALLYKSLSNQYGETKVFKDLPNDKYLETMKKLPFSRRPFDEIM